MKMSVYVFNLMNVEHITRLPVSIELQRVSIASLICGTASIFVGVEGGALIVKKSIAGMQLDYDRPRSR